MRCVQVLSGLALKRLLSRTPQPVGSNGAPHVEHTLARSGHHVARALRQANARAWLAVEVLLAGEPLWERAQLLWERDLEAEFFRPIRDLLDRILDNSMEPESLSRSRQVLEAVLQCGLLTTGGLDHQELIPDLEASDDHAAEWRALGRLADHLEQAGYADLRQLLELRHDDASLLVMLVAAFFRHAVLADIDLFDDLAGACEACDDPAIAEFQPLAVALDKHRSLLDSLLRERREPAPGAAPPPAVDTGAGVLRFQRGLALAQRGDYEQAIGEFTSALQLDPASAQAHVHRGDAHRLKGDYAQALADYTTAVRLDPSNALALFNRGQVHWTMMHVREAIDDFGAALLIEPRNAAAYHYRGKAHAAAGEIDAAIGNFSEALRIDPYHGWAFHDCGDAYASKGNQDLAINNYSEAIRLNPLATLSYLRRAEAYAAKREFERAIADYGNVLRLDPHNVGAYVGRGAAYRQQGMFDQAAADFTRALEFEYSSPGLYFQRGLLFQTQGNHQRALIDFDAAIDLQEDNAEFCYRRGLTHQALGNDDQAIADFSQAVRLDPQLAEAYHERGVLYGERGEADLAVADLGEAIRIRPEFPGAFIDRAKAYARLGRLEEAVADCDVAIEFDATLTQAYVVRGSVLAQQEKFVEAIEDFGRGLRLDAHNPQAFFLRGVAHLKLDNRPHAVADLTEAIRLDPQNARAYAQRAAIRKAGGQHDLALDDYAHAARLDAGFVAAYCNQLGLAHAARGHFERAVADYTIALMLDPNNAAAQLAREQAWKAHLNRPRKAAPSRRVQPLTARRVSRSFAPAAEQPGEPTPIEAPAEAPAAETPVTEAPDPENVDLAVDLESHVLEGNAAETGVHRARDTGIHRVAETTSVHEARTPPIPRLTPARRSAVKQAKPKPQPVKEAEADSALDDRSDSLEVDTVEPQARSHDDADEKAQQVADDHKAYELEQEKIKEKEAEAKRARMAAEFRAAEAKRTEAAAKEAKEAKEAAKKAKKAARDSDDDDDERMPMWKKGVMVAASMLIVWWTGSAALGWVNSPARSMRASVPVTGKAVLGKTGEPLAGAWIRFHPKEGGAEFAFPVRTDGKFSGGAKPGSYVVTVGPDPESGSYSISDSEAVFEIPASYKDAKTSPLTADVGGKDSHFDFKLK